MPVQCLRIDAQLLDVVHVPDRILEARPHDQLRIKDRVFVEAYGVPIRRFGVRRWFNRCDLADEESGAVPLRCPCPLVRESMAVVVVPRADNVGTLLPVAGAESPGPRPRSSMAIPIERNVNTTSVLSGIDALHGFWQLCAGVHVQQDDHSGVERPIDKR